MFELEKKYNEQKSSFRNRLLILFVAGVAFFFLSLWFMNINVAEFLQRSANTPSVIHRMLGVNWELIPELLSQTLLTFTIVFVALTFSVILSTILSFLAADNTKPWDWLAVLIKAAIAIFRSVPDLILGLIVIASIGFGNTPAIMIMTIVGTAQLTRFFIGSIEEVGYEEIEALTTTGASRFSVIVHGVFPVVSSAFLSWVTIQIENTISLSISLGVLGIQGIGSMLTTAQKGYQFTSITTILLFIFILMFLIEIVLTKVRENINGQISR